MNEIWEPPALTSIREDFRALELPDRTQLLLELAAGLPELPQRYAEHPELGEPVPECRTPITFFVELTPRGGGAGGGDRAGSAGSPDSPVGAEQLVHVYATAPLSAPTTRAFAAIVVEGLNGLTPAQVASIPSDYPYTLGLELVVSPMRLRGMTALLARVKRHVAVLASAPSA